MTIKEGVNRLLSNRNVAILLILLHTWIYWMAGSVQDSRKVTLLADFWYHGAAILMALVILALLFRLKRAVAAGVCVLFLLGCVRIAAMTNIGFTWNRAFMVLALWISAYYLWKTPDEGFFDNLDDDADDEPKSSGSPPAGQDDADDKPMISLVQLRSTPRYLEDTVLAEALSEAWGLRITTREEAGDDDDGDGFVAATGPVFMAAVTKPSFMMFMIHNQDQPYFDDAEAVAEKVPNLRFADAIRSHQAWLSVDLLRTSDAPGAEDAAYGMIGKAIAALADDQTLAILCPQHSWFNLWSDELEATLASDKPLEIFRQEVKAPIVSVKSDEDIQSAIAEARGRWPEFVEAFQKRDKEDTRYIVKAPFKEDGRDLEHMWLEVFALEPEYVHGHLINEPFHCQKLKKGSQVEVPVAEISDWLCPDADGNPLGNFTSAALRAVERPGKA